MKKFTKKYFMHEILIISVVFLISLVLSKLMICYSVVFSDVIKNCICNISIILPYVSFIVCFILIFFDERKYKKKISIIRKCKKDFNGLFVKIINGTSSDC